MTDCAEKSTARSFRMYVRMYVIENTGDVFRSAGYVLEREEATEDDTDYSTNFALADG